MAEMIFTLHIFYTNKCGQQFHSALFLTREYANGMLSIFLCKTLFVFRLFARSFQAISLFACNAFVYGL